MFYGTVSLILFALALARSCSAQATTFQWQFANNFVSTSLAQCQNMSIVVKSHNNDNVTFGVPPYYFRAIPVGGIPTFALAGSDRSALSWLVNQPVDSKLILTMVDSNGSSGGVAASLYSVISGTDSSCLPSSPTSQFTVHANISTTVKTCQPWGMTMKGGVQPYTVSLAALDSPIVTNVTLGPLDDVFTFIDRADPNTQLIAAVSDAKGQYANGTGMVSTTGSSNVDCTGLVSSSGNSTKMAAQAAAQQAADASHARSHRRKSIIIGVVVSVVGLAVIISAVLWLMARSRREQAGIIVGQDTRPRLFEVGQIPATMQYNSRDSSHKALLSHPSASFAAPDTAGGPSSSSSPASGGDAQNQPQDAAGSSSHPPQLHVVGEGSSAPRRRSKVANVYMRATRTVGEVFRPTANRNPRDPQDGDIEPDIIIQHRDGGVVQELPPPYADRSGGSRRQ